MRDRRKARARCACLWSTSLLGLLVLFAFACATRAPLAVPPVAEEASLELARAEDCLRQAELPAERRAARSAARTALEHALELAPGWVAPERLLDELERSELRGVEALERHRALAASNPGNARELYLAGRLEGRDGFARFELAVRADPLLAWGYNGLAHAAESEGHAREAVRHARAALARARDGSERAFFTAALARMLVAADQRREAEQVLAQAAARADLSPSARTRLEVLRAELGLEEQDARARAAARERALELLRKNDLSESEVLRLALRLRALESAREEPRLELATAIAAHSSPVRDRLRAELLLDSGPSPLALGLLERAAQRAESPPPRGPLLRAARFAAGAEELAVEAWLADLPANLRAQDGIPRDERLARVVQAERALHGPALAAAARGAALREFGQALIAAGWFREARSLAAELGALDLDGALELDAQASAGQSLIDGLRRLASRGDLARELERNPRPDAERGADAGELALFEAPGDLQALLARMGPLFARAHTFLGGERDSALVTNALETSPELSFRPFGALVHPGPKFSANDAEDGLGKQGERVPGLAAELDRLQRFGLFGEFLGGGGPDGTILPRVGLEWKSGEHLGVHWGGTVAWCEGADLKSKAGRLGAEISAAALHEGYWLDIDSVRRAEAEWEALQREYAGPLNRARVAAVLGVRGFALEGAHDEEEHARFATASGALLGEGARVRLALLDERGLAHTAPGDASIVVLEELIATTAAHEEGHLCDRTRFLPLSQHLGAALRLLLDSGFSAQSVQERLEYRAELVCLCDAHDPRLPLSDVLVGVEGEGAALTPHAAGYARLLSDLLTELEERLASDAHALPAIERDHTLVHQLHRLSAEDVRSLAHSLAHRRGLDRR